jgi:hypothetical protein
MWARTFKGVPLSVGRSLDRPAPPVNPCHTRRVSSVARRKSAARLAGLVLAALLSPFPASATLQCLAEPPRPRPGEEVRVRLTAGAPFEGEDVPPEPGAVERLWNGGRTRLSGEATFSADRPGVHLLAHELRADDLVRSCKAVVVVGAAEPGEAIWRSELGHRLEIVPRTDPALLAAAGGRFEAQVLFDREPLVGATVVAVARKGGKRGYRQTFSDARGDVRFDLDAPGPWLVYLAHKTPGSGGEPGWTLFEASLAVVAGGGD